MVMYRKERTLMTTASSLNSAAYTAAACHIVAAYRTAGAAAYRTAGTAAFHTACCSSDLSSAAAACTAVAVRTAGAVACTVAVRTAAACTAAAEAAGRH